MSTSMARIEHVLSLSLSNRYLRDVWSPRPGRRPGDAGRPADPAVADEGWNDAAEGRRERRRPKRVSGGSGAALPDRARSADPGERPHRERAHAPDLDRHRREPEALVGQQLQPAQVLHDRDPDA